MPGARAFGSAHPFSILISAGTATNEAAPFRRHFRRAGTTGLDSMFIRHSQNKTDCAGSPRRPGSFPPNPSPTNGSPTLNTMTHPIKLLLSTSIKVLPREASPVVGSVPENQNRKGLGHHPQPSAGVCTVGCGETRHWRSFGLFILSSRSRIGDQFWRWEEKHEETSFHFHARPGICRGSSAIGAGARLARSGGVSQTGARSDPRDGTCARRQPLRHVRPRRKGRGASARSGTGAEPGDRCCKEVSRPGWKRPGGVMADPPGETRKFNNIMVRIGCWSAW